MYKGLFSTIRQYWTEYGGLNDFLRSPFTHFSLVVTVLYALGYIEIEWRKIVMDSLPTVLGFSLAAYTITFTLMGSALHRALASAIDTVSGHSLLKIVNSTFFHVIMFQSLALIYALLTKGSLFPSLINSIVESPEIANCINQRIFVLGDVLGCFFSVYAFFLLLSVGIAMFRLGRISPSGTITRSANNDDEQDSRDTLKVTQTRRFKFVAWLSKRLGLYK